MVGGVRVVDVFEYFPCFLFIVSELCGDPLGCHHCHGRVGVVLL